MEYVLDKNLVKQLRHGRHWSQDQLATAAGLSLRTVQRIENHGKCSLESKKALAAVFEVNVAIFDLKPEPVQTGFYKARFGFVGLALGLLGAYVGISQSLASGSITAADTGWYYAGVSTFCGLCAAFIGVAANRFKMSTHDSCC